MAQAKIGVVTNPNSKKNRARFDRAVELQKILGARGIVRETRTVDEIAPAIREFIARDVRYWVSDGGDGALHWLVNQARDEFERRGLALPLTVPTNGGTIDFVAKKVGIRGQADEILRRLVEAEGEGRPLPVEEVPSFVMSGVRRTADGGAEPFSRIGFTAAICGVGQRFFDVYYLDPVPGAETLVRIIALGVGSIALNAPVLSALPLVPKAWRDFAGNMLRPQRARVRVDGKPLATESWRALHLGAMFVDIGGVVKLFPLAGDGKLDLMSGNPSMTEILLNLGDLFRGSPLRHGVEERAVGEVEVEALGDELLAPCIDGEIYRDVTCVKFAPGPLIRIPRI